MKIFKSSKTTKALMLFALIALAGVLMAPNNRRGFGSIFTPTIYQLA